MELYQLRTFAALAEEGNLTRTAERLFTSQPAVSAHIKALESELGLPLFERQRRGMVLTPAGARLAERARGILEGTRAMIGEAGKLRGENAVRLRIGINHLPGFLRTDEILAQMARDDPRLQVLLGFGSCTAVQQAVGAGDMDAGFFDGPCLDRRLHSIELARNELRVVAPKAWAADLASADWKVLEKKPWVFHSPGCSYFGLVAEILQAKRINVPVQFEVQDDRMIFDLVKRGLAMTVLPLAYAQAPEFKKHVCVWPGFRHPMPLSACCLRSRHREPPMRAFFAATHKVWIHPKTASHQNS